MSVEYMRHLDRSVKYLHRQGAYLTVKKGDEVAVTTISWGNMGFEWGRPVFAVLVRESRYIHEMLEDNTEFTVSIPTSKEADEALKIVGSVSGREVDKFKEANITAHKSKTIDTPIIEEADIFYECKIIYSHKINPKKLRKDIDRISYMDDNYHEIFYGEIVNSYTKEEL